MKFIKNHPALLIEDLNAMVIADLHIGLETDLKKVGINIPGQVKDFEERITTLLNKTNAKRLIAIGDIKHSVPGITYQEKREIPAMFERLSNNAKIDICLGNHDTFLKDIISNKIKIHGSKGFKLGKCGFAHGHAWPSKKLFLSDFIIISHTHPAVEFRYKFGYRLIEHAWIKAKIDKEAVKKRLNLKKTGKANLIIMPPFNKLLSGTPLNIHSGIGPLLQITDIENADVYLLDGSYVGKICMIRS